MFQKREALKPKNERRKLPENPFKTSPPITGDMTKEMIDEMNAISMNTFTATLESCQWCGRKFLPDKLIIHNRSCTQENPARKVGCPIATTISTSKVRTSSSFPSSTNTNTGVDETLEVMSRTAPSSSSSLPISGQRLVRPALGGVKEPQTRRPRVTAAVRSSRNDFIPAELLQCEFCGRTFSERAYEKHVKVCEDVFLKKREVYNSSQARLNGTDFERPPVFKGPGKKGLVHMSRRELTKQINAALTSAAEGRGGIGIGGINTGSATKSDWKSKSEEFRRAMKRARQVREAKKKAAETGMSLSKILDNMPIDPRDEAAHEAIYETYVQCPTCNRRFNQIAAERHIPKCKYIVNKPKKLLSHSGSNATTYKVRCPTDEKARELGWNDNTTPYDYSLQGGMNPHFEDSERDALAAYKRNALSKTSVASRR